MITPSNKHETALFVETFSKISILTYCRCVSKRPVFISLKWQFCLTLPLNLSAATHHVLINEHLVPLVPAESPAEPRALVIYVKPPSER